MLFLFQMVYWYESLFLYIVSFLVQTQGIDPCKYTNLSFISICTKCDNKSVDNYFSFYVIWWLWADCVSPQVFEGSSCRNRALKVVITKEAMWQSLVFLILFKVLGVANILVFKHIRVGLWSKYNVNVMTNASHNNLHDIVLPPFVKLISGKPANYQL